MCSKDYAITLVILVILKYGAVLVVKIIKKKLILKLETKAVYCVRFIPHNLQAFWHFGIYSYEK